MISYFEKQTYFLFLINKHFIWVFGCPVTISSAQVNVRYSRKLRSLRKIKLSHLALLSHRKSVFVIRIQSEFCWSSTLYGLVFAFSFAFSECFFLENIFIFWTLVLYSRVICIVELPSHTSVCTYFFCFSCFNKRVKTKQNAIHLYTWEFSLLIFIYKMDFYN